MHPVFQPALQLLLLRRPLLLLLLLLLLLNTGRGARFAALLLLAPLPVAIEWGGEAGEWEWRVGGGGLLDQRTQTNWPSRGGGEEREGTAHQRWQRPAVLELEDVT